MTTTAVNAPVSGRGHLVLEKKVIERIASQAASESRQAGGRSGGVLGFGGHGDLSERPSASVELVGRTATVSLDVAIAYPSPIRAATDEVRRHVMDRVQRLTGVEVTRVDIAVSALTAAAATVRGVS